MVQPGRNPPSDPAFSLAYFSSFTTSRTASIAFPTPLRTRPSTFSALPSFSVPVTKHLASFLFDRAGRLLDAAFNPLSIHDIAPVEFDLFLTNGMLFGAVPGGKL